MIAIPGVPTVAVRVLKFAGALNPDGTSAVSVVVPIAVGSNCVMPALDPPVIVTGEVVMIPTAGLELVTGTLAEKPPPTTGPLRS